MFRGREKELTKLNRLWKRESFEMVIIYGRRRVGKTTLINEFCKGKKSIFYGAVESSKEENLVSFSKSVIEAAAGITGASFRSFDELLTKLVDMTKNERIIVVIDEYPYLAKSDMGFSSLLQKYIDLYLKQTQMFLILCGSSMSFMENQVLGYQSPLYGRRTAQFKIEHFDYYDTAKCFPHFNHEEKALSYGISGGIPLYVNLLSRYKNVKEAMLCEIFDKNAYLFEEPNNLLKQELREAGNYNNIIGAIAFGSSRLNAISTKTGMDTAACTKYIKKLIELCIIRKENPVSDNSSKKTIYQLYDQMFRFWYRFVPPNMSAILSDRIEDTFDKAVLTHLSDYMGLSFEEMAKQYILFHDTNLPIDLGEIGQWWGTRAEDKKQIQIDVVVLSPDRKEAVFGECKFKKNLIDIDVLDDLISNSSAFPTMLNKCYYYIFSKRGFTERLKKRAEEDGIRLITLEDMME